MIFSTVILALFLSPSCKFLEEKRLEKKCPKITSPHKVKLELKLVDDKGASAFFAKAAEKLGEGAPVRIAEETAPKVGEIMALEAVDEPSGKSGRRILEEFVRTLDTPGGRSVAVQKILPYEGKEPVKWHALYLVEPPVITGGHVEEASVSIDAETNIPFVSVKLNETGAGLFADFTAKNIDRRLAILVDGEITSAPVILEKISGGKLQITLAGNKAHEDLVCEAMDLARALGSGK
jgi:preprotein translocase subunit SecD